MVINKSCRSAYWAIGNMIVLVVKRKCVAYPYLMGHFVELGQ